MVKIELTGGHIEIMLILERVKIELTESLEFPGGLIEIMLFNKLEKLDSPAAILNYCLFFYRDRNLRIRYLELELYSKAAILLSYL